MKIQQSFSAREFYLEEFQGLLSQFFSETRFYAQGYWNEVERTKERMRLKVVNAIKPFISPIPKLHQMARFFYVKFILHTSYSQLSQIEDFDKVLSGKHKPFPLVNSSSIPKTIIAVARKQN